MQSPSSLTRALVERLAADPAAVELDAIRSSVLGCDYDTAAARIIARRVRGHAVTLAEVADVLPGLDDLAPMAWLIALTEGDRPAALLELVSHQRFAGDDVGADQEALALFAALRLGDREQLEQLRARIAPRVRLTARWQTTPEGTTLLAALVRQLDDARLTAALPTLIGKEDTALTKELAAMLELSLDGVLAALPRDAATVRSVSGFTVRAAQRPGRNDVCPCGSGKKYKKCHGAKEEGAALASPVAGLSWEDYLRTAADRLTEDEVQRLALRDLARVELAQLRDGPLVAAARRFAVRRRWDLAATAIDALAKRDVPPKLVDERRAELLLSALAHGEIAFARREGEKLADRSAVPAASWLEIEIGEHPPEVLTGIDAQAREALRSDDPMFALDLAHTLLARVPALGVFVGRGALPPDANGRATRDLLDAIEDARAELHLPPGDVSHDFVASLDQAAARDREILAAETATKKVAEEAAVLRVELRGLNQKLLELRSTRLDEPSPPSPQVEESEGSEEARAAERRALRAKVDELKALIKEGNVERQDLRQQLAQAAPVRSEAAPQEQAEDDADELAPAKRGIVIPRLGKRVEETLPELPQPVAAEALRTIGALAAGDEAAWTRVKQAKDMPRQVLMARLGIHYRLLFRAGAGTLDVLELVPRESLDGALKRLRSG